MSFEVGPSGCRFTIVICDTCGTTEEYDTASVDRAATFAEASGWDIESNEQAICPTCRPPDDEGEQIRRDREIDARVSPAGELIGDLGLEWGP